jgi:hypothetical protein
MNKHPKSLKLLEYKILEWYKVKVKTWGSSSGKFRYK